MSKVDTRYVSFLLWVENQLNEGWAQILLNPFTPQSLKTDTQTHSFFSDSVLLKFSGDHVGGLCSLGDSLLKLIPAGGQTFNRGRQ